MMLKIAITGRIATGKTAVSKILVDLGYKVFESDKEVKKIYKDTIVVEAIRKIFSNKIPNLIEQNKINMNNLGNYVFSKKSQLKKLEEIIHPYIWEKKSFFLLMHPKEKVLFFDIPLLFEKKLQNEYDYIFYTKVDLQTQKKRALQRDKMNMRKLEQILTNQTSLPNNINSLKLLELDTSLEKNQTKRLIKSFLQERGL
ncbi:MAG: dephospho-CoA kinase [Pelagibacteraceae bacterium TMED65]|nr:dephospho-CoA kinase [Rickettsiales bacterium]OUU51492.1 MAG: dephospho-CoA kinase [Pelagibacteraceae bacterium TMED65]|tara:strand:- start:1772 stop:2368 length:597 start_codon:yes stop_codon:yes gene_type:complete